MLYKVIAASFIGLTAASYTSDELSTKFQSWKSLHSKSYRTVVDEARALNAFISNEKIITEHNAKGLSYTLGHNEFSDLTWEEFKLNYMAGGNPLFTNTPKRNPMRVHIKEQGLDIPDSVDWTTKGAVTPVKNQGQCGSCWAFSTTGSVEGAYSIASGKLVSLSEEDLVECDHNGDQGCNGGLMDHAFEWIEKNGICLEKDYPYSSGGGETGTCKSGCSAAVTVTGFTDVAKDEDALKSAVAKQPVSIAIEADKSAFQLYKSGVLDNSACGTQLDHGVLVVGYGTDSDLSKDFWKVKNSWGSTWGEDGYIRMVRGKNQCGIKESASFPTGAKKASPSPGPSPGPSPPSPSPPSSSPHYEDPKGGCRSDELQISIQGVSGDFCSPHCSLFKACPKDVPTGVSAGPQCALSSPQGDKFCALICSPTAEIADQKAADAQCGTNASCKAIQGVGICTYDD